MEDVKLWPQSRATRPAMRGDVPKQEHKRTGGIFLPFKHALSNDSIKFIRIFNHVFFKFSLRPQTPMSSGCVIQNNEQLSTLQFDSSKFLGPHFPITRPFTNALDYCFTDRWSHLQVISQNEHRKYMFPLSGEGSKSLKIAWPGCGLRCRKEQKSVVRTSFFHFFPYCTK